MKFTKRLLCFLLTALLVLPVCGGLLSSAAAEYSFKEDSSKAYEVTDGVFYSEYTLSSGIYENVYVSASALEFNTEDYMVVAYGGAAGGAAYLANQYRLATEDGYEVVGAINGSFFSMDTGSNGNYGYLNEYLISGGEIYSADNGNTASEFGGAVAFMSDGTFVNVPDSCLSFDLVINGKSIPGGLSHVNKYGGRYKPSNWGNGFYYFDTHSGDLYYDVDKDANGKVYGEMISQALTFDNVPGYQVLCRKVDGSRLAVDNTLRGEVISVSDDAYGTKLAEDEFILFVKADSPNAAYVKDLAAGDKISVTATELGGKSTGITAKADSVIGICGYLVKDGKNLTTSASFNSGAAHDNKTKARWTAFGIKADGSYVFFTTEGASTGSDGSVTLQDVAKAMMEMGCVDVIRLDGGGSSAMYVCDDGTGKAGFKQKSSRSIGDCLLIVKRTSPALQKGKTELKDLVPQYESKTGKAYKEAVSAAKTVLNSKTSVSGDYFRAYNGLLSVSSAEAELTSAAADAKTAVKDDYAITIWNSIQTLKKEAENLLKGDPSLADMERVGSALRSALSSTGEYENNLALGKTYTSKTASNSTYPDTNGSEMTDGLYGPASSAYGAAWAGWNSDNVFTIDLGEVYDDITTFKIHALQLTSWGINVPSKITVAVSEDGKTFTDVGDVPDPEGLTRKEEGAAYTLTLALEKGVKARYVRITPKRISFFFWSEIEVIRYETAPNYIVPEISLDKDDVNTKDVPVINKNWGDGTDKITLIQNPNCTHTGMDVTVDLNLGSKKKINGAALGFYHCAGVMIGYPEGDVTVLISNDGKTYTEVGTFALAEANVAVDSYGTVKSVFVFDTVEAKYVQFKLKAGSSRPVLGANPADGKVNWEFVALTGVTVSDESKHKHSYTDKIIKKATFASPGVKEVSCSCGYSEVKDYTVAVQPEKPAALPSGAFVLDYAGYKHAGEFSIVAGDNMTVAELTALGNGGVSRDMNYAYIIVVDGNGIVTKSWCELGVAKSDEVCPEGGYIISYNGNKNGYADLKKVQVGQQITLINIDVDVFRGLEGNMELTNAGFTVGEPGDTPVEPPVDDPSEDPSEDPVDPPSEDPVDPPSDDPEEPVEPDAEWIGEMTQGGDGNCSADVPYGYVWIVDYVDGKIGGEDVTICTTDDAYKACNPNWAITILLEKQADGTYVAVKDAVVTPGDASKVTVGENQVALVVHSSSSNPDAGYDNWQGKVVAISIKAGDVFTINEDMTAVQAVIPEDLPGDESSEEPSDDPSQPSDESSEEPDDESSEEPDESSEEASAETSAEASAPVESSVPADDEGGSALLIVIIVVVVVAVIGAVVFIVIKRKK